MTRVVYTIVGFGDEDYTRVAECLDRSAVGPMLADRPDIIQFGGTGNDIPTEEDLTSDRLGVWAKNIVANACERAKRRHFNIHGGVHRIGGFYNDNERVYPTPIVNPEDGEDEPTQRREYWLTMTRLPDPHVIEFDRRQLAVAGHMFEMYFPGVEPETVRKMFWGLGKYLPTRDGSSYFTGGQFENTNAYETATGATGGINSMYPRRALALGQIWPEHPLLATPDFVALADDIARGRGRSYTAEELADVNSTVPAVAKANRVMPLIHYWQPGLIHQKWPVCVSMADAWATGYGIALTGDDLGLWLKAENDTNTRHTIWRLDRTLPALADGIRAGSEARRAA